ncbi:clathrin coat assembly protein AP180 [Gambusia affinis]|uniref:clathrin coat assembly protein AP180 n=1 Tax=Gambusia affinis TaxID=33528 RepID=UPI001CDBA2DA|nr:clathrin coat assembly protein AP180 [Gambusia affinis]
MMTVENNSSLDVCFSSMETQPSPSPSPSPLFTSTSITTTATISGSDINSTATDLFGDMFDSMPDSSFSKTDPLPSTDLFSAADLFSSSAPILSAPPPKIDTGGIMSLFGGG